LLVLKVFLYCSLMFVALEWYIHWKLSSQHSAFLVVRMF
jgi:hypothetical protein